MMITFLREYCIYLFFPLVSFFSLSAIVRFDPQKGRGFSLFTTFLVGLFVPCAVSTAPHVSQYAEGNEDNLSETASNRRKLTGKISMVALPVIILFNILLLSVLVLSVNFKVSPELVLDNNGSKQAAKHFLLWFLIPSGILAFIASFCVQKNTLTNRHLSVLAVSFVLVFISAVGTISTFPTGKGN